MASAWDKFVVIPDIADLLEFRQGALDGFYVIPEPHFLIAPKTVRKGTKNVTLYSVGYDPPYCTPWTVRSFTPLGNVVPAPWRVSERLGYTDCV